MLQENFHVVRHETGALEISVGAQNAGAVRRLLIECAGVINAFGDIDAARQPAPAPMPDPRRTETRGG